jgi:hypothetical protein
MDKHEEKVKVNAQLPAIKLGFLLLINEENA